jgi:hypothetical protein
MLYSVYIIYIKKAGLISIPSYSQENNSNNAPNTRYYVNNTLQ